jgi:hypothetical protein
MSRRRCPVCERLLPPDSDRELHRSCREQLERDESGAVAASILTALNRGASGWRLSTRLSTDWLSRRSVEQRIALWRWLFDEGYLDGVPACLIPHFLTLPDAFRQLAVAGGDHWNDVNPDDHVQALRS